MITRMRRLRQNEVMRSLVRETHLQLSELIYPIFVIEGEKIKHPIPSMPGVFQYSIDCLDDIVTEVVKSGIQSLLLFGIPKRKDEVGSEAYNENGIMQRAISFIKKKYKDLVIIADVCLCEYTSHGHCGVVDEGEIINDATLPLLTKMAVSLARAGADIIAPSDMMDGRVAAIRKGLDDAGYIHLPIMAYSAKYASKYYGPFREAAKSAPSFGDRKSYQMDCANVREAMREIEADIKEGADLVMVKPALAYLDVIKSAYDRFDMPIVAYNVSGEYAMVKVASEKGYLDEKGIVMENLLAMKRAGAKMIITYHALDVAKWLKKENEV